MKILVKWSRTIVISLVILMALAVYITIGNKGEETSKFGFTKFGRSGAETYIKQLDLNVASPKNYLRYFQDTSRREIASEMKKYDALFVVLSEDYHYYQEFYILPDFSEISYSSTEERVRNYQFGYQLTRDTVHDDITLGDITFHRVCYSTKYPAVSDYCVTASYFMEHNGVFLEIRCYVEDGTEKDFDSTIADVTGKYEKLLSDYSFGKPANTGEEGNYLIARLKTLTFAPWIIVVPFIFALLCGITYMGRSERLYDSEFKKYYYMGDGCTGWNDDFLSLKTSKMILGFFAVLIVFHHLVQQADRNDSGILYILENFGVGFVGMFFFFSGYGLYESFKNKPDYLKKFFSKRLPPVLVPFYCTIIIFLIHHIVTAGFPKAGQFISWLTGWKLINSHMWYIVEIVILYIVFYLLFRIIKNKSIALILMFIFTGGMVGYSLYLGHGDSWFQGEWWYNTSLIFPFGMLFAKHKEHIVDFMKHFYGLVLITVTVIFVALNKATEYALNTYSYWSEFGTDKGYDDKLRCLIVQCPMVLFFVLLVLLIGMKLRIGNRFLKFLGEISLELYLIHNLFMGLYSSFKGTGTYFTLVITSSIIAAAIIHRLDTFIICLICKKPFPKGKGFMQIISEIKDDRRKRFDLLKKNIRLCLTFTYRHPKRTLIILFRHAVCICLCIIALFPISVLVINSTKTTQEIIKGFSLLPGGSFAENLVSVKMEMDYISNNIYAVILRSCFISVTCAFVGTYIGTLCAYGFEYYKFKGRNVLWGPVFAAMLIPGVAGVVGYLKLVFSLRLHNHYFPIIMVGIAIPSCVYFMRMYLHSMNLGEIIEAARIDGCNEFITFNKIILPVIRPAILLQLVFNFTLSWNNTIYQKLVLLDIKKKTIALVINNFAGYNAGNDPVLYCMVLVGVIPSLVVYILFSPGIISRINLGSIKE